MRRVDFHTYISQTIPICPNIIRDNIKCLTVGNGPKMSVNVDKSVEQEQSKGAIKQERICLKESL